MNGAGQYVDVEQALADQRVALITAHVEKAAVDPYITPIGQPDDERGRRVRLEHRLEPLLRGVAFRHVLDDEREAIGLAAILVHDDVAHLVHPARLVAADGRHLDHQIGKTLAREQAHQRIVASCQPVMVAVAQTEAVAIFVGGGAEIGDAGQAVHAQRGLVRPQNRARRIHEDHARAQPVDELAQMVQRRAGDGGDGLGQHAGKARVRSLGSTDILV